MKDVYDVVIIGGGPAGSTVGSFLKKYRPELSVAIFERETFPRDHVGESQLPPLSYLLDEMGCWEKVEAANFPIKIGATYRWGKSEELWDFEFIPPEKFKDEPRPSKFEGQRRGLAFQVDRAVYDKILLDHAREIGCEVFENSKVVKVHRMGDEVTGVTLESGKQLSARYYVDASGHSGILRRAVGVKVDTNASLQNIAIWNYWSNADWAVKIGVGATRVQVLSVCYGWIWFIPLSPTRTSIGLIVPADYYKTCGLSPKELYHKAVSSDKLLKSLISNASEEGKIQTTKDWSFLSQRMVGANWFLVGESAGFADPILAAGLTISQSAAREAAYTIIALEEAKQDQSWLKREFELRQITQIKNHIRFANYWYTSNGQFTDLKEYTAKIAEDNGLDLAPDKAWAWIAQGGFINLDLAIGAAGFDIHSIKDMAEFMGTVKSEFVLEKYNVLKLNLKGATWKDGANYLNGKVIDQPRYVRGSSILPIYGVFQLLLNILQQESRMAGIAARLAAVKKAKEGDDEFDAQVFAYVVQGLEAMISEGWIDASYDPSLPSVPIYPATSQVKKNHDQLHLQAG